MTYVRDDRPFGGPDPPAATFHYSRNRSGEHPARHLASYAGILQADAYAGFGELYDAGRWPGPIAEAACWSHGRRKFFELADPRKAPLAIEAVCRIDAIFAIERELNGVAAEDRCAIRQNRVAPMIAELAEWMRAERGRPSRHADTAKAIDYMLKRWPAFTRFLDGIALGRKAWLFAGSDRGGERAAAIYTLIGTAKLNDVDPQAWLADVLGRGSTITQPPASTNSCPGTEKEPTLKPLLPEPAHRGLGRMLTLKQTDGAGPAPAKAGVLPPVQARGSRPAASMTS